MKLRVRFRLEIILFLFLAEIVMTALSAFFFTRLDQVVHGDLYKYGLQFNYEWAWQYWANSRLIMSSLLTAIAVNGFLFVFFLVPLRSREIAKKKFVSCLLLVVGIAATALSAYFFNKLDYIVNHDLYMYGLRFSYEWAAQYWAYVKLMLILLGLAAATSTVSMTVIIIGVRTREKQFSLRAHALPKLDPTKLIPPILFSTGVLTLALSLNYSSSTLAFIGLGLVFWGAILYYISPQEYVQINLFGAATLSTLQNLDSILKEHNYKGKAVYLPPKYLKDFESSKVYLGIGNAASLPTPEQIQQKESEIPFSNPSGTLLIPPGAEIVTLFENTLGTSFTKVDLRFLENNLPKLFIEDLEIAENIEIEIEDKKVRVKIEGSVYMSISRELKNFSYTTNLLGCPISSAIACALAKATGKPLIVDKYQMSDNGRTISIEYFLVEEGTEEQAKL